MVNLVPKSDNQALCVCGHTSLFHVPYCQQALCNCEEFELEVLHPEVSVMLNHNSANHDPAKCKACLHPATQHYGNDKGLSPCSYGYCKCLTVEYLNLDVKVDESEDSKLKTPEDVWNESEPENEKDGSVKIYRRKAPRIQAGIVTSNNIDTLAIWCGGEVKTAPGSLKYQLFYPTLGGNGIASLGNYLIRDERGRFSSLPAADFEIDFEES